MGPDTARSGVGESVSAEREDDRFYELNFSGLYARIVYFYEYTYGIDVVLSSNGYSGILTFESGRTCKVSNLMSEVK